MRYTFFKDSAAEWRWRAQAGNNEIIATSGEGYTRLENATKMVEKYFFRVDDSVFIINPETGALVETTVEAALGDDQLLGWYIETKL